MIMGKLSGYIEKVIGDRSIGFKFGTGLYKRITRDQGIELYEIDKYLKKLDEYDRMVELFYFAAMFAADINEEIADFNRANVEEWLDELSIKDIEDIMKVFNESKIRGKKIADLVKATQKKKSNLG